MRSISLILIMALMSISNLYSQVPWFNGSNILSNTVDKTSFNDETIQFIEESGGSATYPEWMEVEIPLNVNGYPGIWTDFEIKIFQVTNSVEAWTTNNLVYYHQSWTNIGSNAWEDSDPRVYYVDDHWDTYPASYYMRWKLATNEVSIFEQRVSLDSVIETVILNPSKAGCAHDWQQWQWYTNAHNLRASYVRFDGTGPEMNEAGTMQRWQLVPIRWRHARMNEND